MAAIDGDLELEIACVKREIGMRERVYPRWVADGRMTQMKATDEIQTMRRVQERLEGLRPKDLLGG